jgi:hypothetical protein
VSNRLTSNKCNEMRFVKNYNDCMRYRIKKEKNTYDDSDRIAMDSFYSIVGGVQVGESNRGNNPSAAVY